MVKDRPLTPAQQIVLDEIKRRGGSATTGSLRTRATVRDWEFDPRNVVRGLERRGLVEQVWSAWTRETYWTLTDAR